MHGITAVYDVRSKPFSRFNRQYNRETLNKILSDAGIAYVFMGDSLGGRPTDPGCYAHGKISYELQARTPLFQAGLDKLRRDAEVLRIAIMCAEKNPLECHRTWSIAEHMQDMHILHIMSDGRLEEHSDMMHKNNPAARQEVLGF